MLGLSLSWGHCSLGRQWLSAPHKALIPNQIRILPKFTPWGASEFTRLTYRVWVKGCLKEACDVKAATQESLPVAWTMASL